MHHFIAKFCRRISEKVSLNYFH